MSEKIIVPVLGESITEATVSKWLKKEGETVDTDEPIVELETDKVNLEVLFENYPVLFVDKYSDITEELLLANDDLFQQAQTMDLSDLTLPKFFDNIVDKYVNT